MHACNMERFKINRRTPRMTFDEVVSLRDEDRLVELLEDGQHIRISNEGRRHHLTLGETIYFRKRSGEPGKNVKDWGVYSSTPAVVTDIEDEFTFVCTVPGYDKVYHISNIDTEVNTFDLDDNFCYLPEDFNEVSGLTASIDRGVKVKDGELVADLYTFDQLYPVYRHRPELNLESYDPDYDREHVNAGAFGLDPEIDDLSGDILPIISRYTYREGESFICAPDDIEIDECGLYVTTEFISSLGGTEAETIPEDKDIDENMPDLLYKAKIVEVCYHGDKIIMTGYTYYDKVEDIVFDYDAISVMPLRFNMNNYYYSVGDDYDDENIFRLFASTEIVRSLQYYVVPANLSVPLEYNLLQQQTITDLFSDEIKSKIIPEFIDMEKYMFEPAMDGSGEIMADEIRFNLHFRERDMKYVKVENPTPEMFKTAEQVGRSVVDNATYLTPQYVLCEHEFYEKVYDDSWNTNDETGWNNEEFTALTRSDLIGALNFNNDDVRYQKMKLKKSFIRLSFYDSDNPLTQQLLYYSTIFIDSGDLFGKFVKNRATPEGKYFGVFDGANEEDESKRLSTRFAVKNKYNADKSSEGFYLYLFGSEFPKTGEPREIYMKVEFNHAGYGRTLPFIKPPFNGQMIMKNGVRFDHYFESLYIKLGAKYKPYGDCNYIYYVDEPENNAITFDMSTRTINFNLFEVKIW